MVEKFAHTYTGLVMTPKPLKIEVTEDKGKGKHNIKYLIYTEKSAP